MDRLGAMHTFVRVVDAGSFSGAAKLLNIGQPAVSKSIAQLETRLGVRLLMRSTHGLTPTEAGRHFCEHARRAIEEADEADLAAAGADAGLGGRLRVGAGATFGSLHIVPRLPAFLAAYPNLSVDLVLDDRPIDLIEEGIDVGVRIGPLRDSSQTVRKLATSRRLVIGTPAYFERAGVPTAPEKLTEHATVIHVHDTVPGDAWTFSISGSHVSVKVSGRLRVSAVDGMRAAVMAGMGLAITSEWLFAPELQQGTVRAVLTDWVLPASDLWLLFPTGRAMSAKARAFTTFLRAELQKHPVGPEPGTIPMPLLRPPRTAMPEEICPYEISKVTELRQMPPFPPGISLIEANGIARLPPRRHNAAIAEPLMRSK